MSSAHSTAYRKRDLNTLEEKLSFSTVIHHLLLPTLLLLPPPFRESQSHHFIVLYICKGTYGLQVPQEEEHSEIGSLCPTQSALTLKQANHKREIWSNAQPRLEVLL